MNIRNNQQTKAEETANANPFKVPEGYFEELSSQILSRLPEKTENEPQTLSLWERVQPWIYMAAMFAGIALMVKIFVPAPPTLDLTSTAEIEEFYQYYEEQFAGNHYHETLYLDGISPIEDYPQYEQ
jgi:hypothetical protein